MSISAEEAFDAYEAVRHRLPVSQAQDGGTRRIETLAEIAETFDTFLLDAFGVLNIGETAIPGACERVAALLDTGHRVLVVSNAASVPQAALLEKYRHLGFPFALNDIVTSRATLAAAMVDKGRVRWGVMAGHRAVFDDFGDMDIRLLEDDMEAFQAVDGFLLIGSASWTEARQAMLEDALKTRQRPVLVANPDIVAPREGGFSVEPGHFAHQLADRTGVTPEFFGKPFRNIFDLAFERLGPVDRSRVVMVGDSLHTDILGAQTAGVASALMSGYGFFAGHDVDRAIATTGIVPDYIVTRP